MDDKSFELMSKIYTEFTQRFDGIEKEIKGLKGNVLTIENKLDTNSKALFNGYKQTYEKLVSVEQSGRTFLQLAEAGSRDQSH